MPSVNKYVNILKRVCIPGRSSRSSLDRVNPEHVLQDAIPVVKDFN